MTSVEDEKLVRFVDGVRSEHPRPRCACGGIIDAHPTRDASVCRVCGNEADGDHWARIEPVRSMVTKGGALYVDTAHGPIKVTADPTVPPGEVAFVAPVPVSSELLAHQDRLVRATHEAMGMPADLFRGVDRSTTPEKLSGAMLQKAPAQPGKQWVTPVVYEQRPARADGFDQYQVDAAKAALLAPAPPRYPRSQ